MNPTTTNHLENWLPESEAAARLRISERTLRRRAAAGEGPEKRERQRPGARAEAVYNPDDVERLAATPPAVFSPANALTMRGMTEQPNRLAPLEQLAVLLHTRLSEPPRPPARWLTLKQARETSGLSIVLLRRLIEAGRLRVLRDGAWKILQADLDGLDNVDEFVRTVAKVAKPTRGDSATRKPTANTEA
jgi:hypothetical protein